MKSKAGTLIAATIIFWMISSAPLSRAQRNGVDLKLPSVAVSRRASVATTLPPRVKRTFATLSGPGCIRHIWASHSLPQENSSRNSILRIYFDDEPVPYVEAPSGDFFGVMHGKPWYAINTPFLSVQAEISFNCYFPMPFAKSARVEFESGDEQQVVFCMVDWQEFPEQEMKEKRRFCARWRREFPTQSFGENFLMFDADGPGQLLGYVFGLRLVDYKDRWSHGGADNIYIDGDGEHPSYIRGIGGEDTFGTSDGGSLHKPTTHLSASMPLFEHFDDGKTRPAKYITGYRFFHNEPIHFRKSIQMRFGCMSNDICATAYWYQEGAVRPFFKMPEFSYLAPRLSGKEIPRGSHDLPIPDSGAWSISEATHTDEVAVAAQTPLDEDESLDPNEWKALRAMHGFVDILHARRPNPRGAGIYIHSGAASARAILSAPSKLTAKIRLAWDDRLVLRVNDAEPIDLGHRDNFGDRTVEVPLRKGDNLVDITLSNTQNFNHGGWAFAFQATAPDGTVLLPRAAGRMKVE